MSEGLPRHALNAPGDFYVEGGSCISCRAPEESAPDLMTHEGDWHCYFKRQPQTPAEVEQAIEAVVVSCCNAVRYGGRDPRILAQLIAEGKGNECDHAPRLPTPRQRDRPDDPNPFRSPQAE